MRSKEQEKPSMRIDRFRTALLTLPIAFAGFAAHVSAQGRPAQPHGQQAMRYAEMDTDGDGVITRGEWRGSRQEFIDADVNRDGVLSGNEVRVNGGPVGTTGGNDDRRSEFQNLDTDNDGIISRNEWRGSRAEFLDEDVNNDGVITRREYLGRVINNDSPAQANDGIRNRGGRPEVAVSGTSRWTDMRVFVNQGDIITFDSQGEVQLSTGGEDVATTAGARSGRTASNAPLPSALAGALIGRIGNSMPFGVGNQRQITAPATGQLFLGVNDDYLQDNSGEFRVRVSVR
jgi:Ca2+-binding EF-hand superfamily protein